MLSILIPTYNYVCVKLVSDLQQQAEGLGCPYEILVADDASDECYKRGNRKINGIPHCKYVELQKNVGRSCIRNILARLAQYDSFLFLDCDGKVVRHDFIRRYMDCRKLADVVCGGILHPDKLPSPKVSLRYAYEKSAERRFTAHKRTQRPFGMFRSFNFLISRNAFNSCPFDESIRDYGYEDVLMGLQLERQGFQVLHIDNPLMNEDIERNGTYLRKTEESIRTLYAHRDKLEGNSGILRMHETLQRKSMLSCVLFLYRLFRPVIRRNLLGRHPSLFLFGFYKIGYYARWEQKERQKEAAGLV